MGSVRRSQSFGNANRREHDAIIIGAGAAGLATARALQSGGIRAVVLEQGERPAQSWWSRYEGLRLNTVRWLSDLPPQRMPRQHGRWPKREQWAAYLESFSEHLDLRLETTAERIDSAPGGWTVETEAGAMTTRFVVVATGHDRIPVVPDWPGRDAYEGRIMHSSEFLRAEDLSDHRVLVVGAGNSGAEIASLLAAKRIGVAISVRTSPLILKRDIAGVPVTLLGELARVAPDSLIDWAGRRIHRSLWGDLAPFGLRAPEKHLSAMRHTYYSPPLDSGFVRAVKAGAIEVVDAVEGFDGPSVLLKGGERLEADVVIAATGFRPGLERLVGHLGVLDEEGEPRIAARRGDGLFFAGFRFGLLALLPYVEGDARGIASAIGFGGGLPRSSILQRPLKITGLRP